MPQAERLRVWKGELKKTSGGLRKKDLMKNHRGKIVSKKKSEAAKKSKDKNNLAGWLRQKGDQFLSKGITAEHVVRKAKRKKKLEKLSLPGMGPCKSPNQRNRRLQSPNQRLQSPNQRLQNQSRRLQSPNQKRRRPSRKSQSSSQLNQAKTKT